MPSADMIDRARPNCPGTSTNVTTHRNRGLGRSSITTTQHLPCGIALTWDHASGGWECPDHGIVLSGEQAAGHWTDTIELDAVESEAA